MCDGKMFRPQSRLELLTDLGMEDFASIPPTAGVYCVRTTTTTVGSISTLIGGFKRSSLMRAEKSRDEASAKFFRQVGLATIYGWNNYDTGETRLDRLRRIDVVGGKVKCPILYFGSTKHLTPNPPKDTDGRREESGRGVRELQGK